MKLKFWKRNPKPQGDKPQGIKLEMVAFIQPKAAIEGKIVRFSDGQAEVLEDEGTVLERLGVAVSVIYDPTAHGQEFRRPWVIHAPLEYNWKGHCYGADGPAVVKGVGLEFPNAATPWANDVDLEDGVLTWRLRARPDAEQIAQVVQEAQRQVAHIMRRYGETKAILAELDKGAK